MARRTELLLRRKYFGNRQSRVAVWRIPRQTPMSLHRHEFFEIAAVLSGAAVHRVGGVRHHIKEGDVLFLHPHFAHGYEETRGLNLLNILIRRDALSLLGREWADQPAFHVLFTLRGVPGGPRPIRSVHLAPREMEQLEGWAARLEELGVGERIPRRLEEAYLALIIDVLCRKYVQSLPRRREKGPLPKGPSGVPSKLGRLLSWVEMNLARPLALADLAVQAGMSERTLLRHFRTAVGLTPRAYIQRLRLSRAAQRLADGADESITATALACGFADSNYFAFCFHRYAGMSPRRYRQKHALRHRGE